MLHVYRKYLQRPLAGCALLLVAAGPLRAQEDEPAMQALKRTRQLAHRVAAPAHPSAIPCYSCVQPQATCDLIPNGSFEKQVTAPTRLNNMGGGRTGEPCPNDIIASEVASWSSPTAGSPEYYSTNAGGTACYANASADVNPNTALVGAFSPFGGNSAIGLFTRQAYFDPAFGNRDRMAEYATAPLAQPLTSGQYYAQCQVSLPSTTALVSCGVAGGFGMAFHNAAVPRTNARDFVTPSGAQTVLGGPITAANINASNPSAWTRVSGQFAATGTESFVTVGMFDPNPALFQYLPGRAQDGPRTYFLVDNVQLFKIPTAAPAQPVVSFCGPITLGSGCYLGAPFTYAWVLFGGGVIATTLQLTVSPSQSQIDYYTLIVTMPDGSQYSTTYAVYPCEFLSDIQATNNQVSNCSPRTISVNTYGGSGDFSYTWTANPASSVALGNGPSITVSPSVLTVYTVAIVDNATGRTVTQSITVAPVLTGTPSVFVPNVFTPNGDGINDNWEVRDANRGFGPINVFGYRLRVFDRWGSMKYQTSFTDIGTSSGILGGQIRWNGRTNSGSGCVDGAYLYAVDLDNCNGTRVEFIKGWVQISGSSYRMSPKNPDDYSVGVYPNPADDQVLIDPAQLTNPDAMGSRQTAENSRPAYSVEVIDNTGVTRLRMAASSQPVVLNTSSLPDGSYHLRLIGSQGKVITKRLMVNHAH